MNDKFPSPPDSNITDEDHAALSKAFECRHEIVRLRWRNEKKQAVWQQCLNCGVTVGTAIKHSTLSPSMLSALEMWDETLGKKRDELRFQAYESRKQEKQAEWQAWYSCYLNSSIWQAKRKLVLAREQGLCEGCRDKGATQVHHLSYKHVGGNELLFELIAVCDKCHAMIHQEPD